MGYKLKAKALLCYADGAKATQISKINMPSLQEP